MARKVRVEIKFVVNITLEEGESIDTAIQEMDYKMSYTPDNGENRVEVIDLRDYDIVETNLWKK